MKIRNEHDGMTVTCHCKPLQTRTITNLPQRGIQDPKSSKGSSQFCTSGNLKIERRIGLISLANLQHIHLCAHTHIHTRTLRHAPHTHTHFKTPTHCAKLQTYCKKLLQNDRTTAEKPGLNKSEETEEKKNVAHCGKSTE